MKFYIYVLLSVALLAAVTSSRLTRVDINKWGKQNCIRDKKTPELGTFAAGENRWYAKSSGKNKCPSYKKTQNCGHCYEGEAYKKICTKKHDTPKNTDCSKFKKYKACKKNHCKLKITDQIVTKCLTRCTGCYFVTDKPSSSYEHIIEESGTSSSKKFWIGSESYNDYSEKWLIDKKVCKGLIG